MTAGRGIREERYELRYITAVGTRVGLHVSALGKALLAQLEPAQAHALLGDKALKSVTPRSVTDPAQLQRQLRDVCKRGYAQVEGEGTAGVSAMAVAGRVGEQLLAISLAGPSDRLLRHQADYTRALLWVKRQVFGGDGELSRPRARRT